jgi:hypothetical protein
MLGTRDQSSSVVIRPVSDHGCEKLLTTSGCGVVLADAGAAAASANRTATMRAPRFRHSP